MTFNPKYIPYIIMVITIAIAAFSWQKYQASELQKKIDAQNYAAQTDSLSFVIDKKTGEAEASKASYVLKESELEAYNKELADEVKREKGKVVSLSRTVVALKQDTATLRKALQDIEQPEPIQVNDSTYNIPWNVYYQYDSINSDYYEGVSQIEIGVGNPYKVRHIFTELQKRETQIGMTFGQKVEDNQLRVFIQSKYPGFTPQQLDGVLIDPNTNPYIKGLMKKKHWFTGFGVGPNLTMGYDFFNAKPALIFGVGIQYNVYQW